MRQITFISRFTNFQLRFSRNHSARTGASGSSPRTGRYRALKPSLNPKVIVLCVAPIILSYLLYDSRNHNELQIWRDQYSPIAIRWSTTAEGLKSDKGAQFRNARANLMDTAPKEQLQPGRPETLTKEEESKLKDFWSAVLKVFGVGAAVETGALVEKSNEVVAATGETQDVLDKKIKKGKLGSLLYRNKKGKDDQSSPPSPSPAASTLDLVAKIDEKDDKYGLVKDFKAALAGQTPAELRAAFWSMVKHDNPDALLLRFLRARKWDVDKALIMIFSMVHWQATEMKVHEIVERGELGAIKASDGDFLKQLRTGKSFLHGWDKEGRPICLVRVRLHRAGEQSEESIERYTIYIMETARLFLVPPVDTACIIFDMTGFSLANMDYPPVRFMIKCFEAHYPESLGICLIHKAPWIFQGIWSIIKGWLDPVVASKIHFTKSLEDLEAFIPKSNIIKELGGPEEWEYNFTEPSLDENAATADKHALQRLQSEREEVIKQYEGLTRIWISEVSPADNGDSPKSPSSKIKSQRLEIAKKLRDGYWVMDKYIRGRTIYDRTGVIRSDGYIDFYHAADNIVKRNTTNEEDVD